MKRKEAFLYTQCLSLFFKFVEWMIASNMMLVFLFHHLINSSKSYHMQTKNYNLEKLICSVGEGDLTKTNQVEKRDWINFV
jgi:hypothetical protein